MWNTTRALVAALALVIGFNGCVGCGDGGGGGGNGHQTSGQSWTVLVYMVADNDLEPFALYDLDEMAAVGQNGDFRFVVQADRSDAYTADGIRNMGNWTTAKRLVVETGGLQEVGDIGEVNMGDPNTLADFIEWGMKTYPADRYALVFWDHGGSWIGFGSDDSTGNPDTLTVPEMKAGVSNGLSRAGKTRFAMVGFDACLMSTFEVAEAFKPYAEYLLASEELEPGHGWDWQSFNAAWYDPSIDPVALGRSIIDGFIAQAQANDTSAKVTLSLTDLYALADLETAVGALAAEGQKNLDTSSTLLARSRSDALAFNRAPDESQSSHMLDIGDLGAKLAAGDGRFSAVKSQLDAALQKAVVYRAGGPVTAAATGLSIYFPPYGALYRADYDDLTEVGGWRTFLKAYFGDGTTSGIAPRFVSTTALASIDAGKLNVQAQLQAGAADHIANAQFLYGFVDGQSGNVIVVGDAPAGWDANNVWGQWDLSILTMTQGAETGYGYLSIQDAGNSQWAAVLPLAYKENTGAAEQYAMREIIFDAAGNVQQDTYYVIAESGAVGQLWPPAGSSFTPLLQVVDPQGNVTWGYGGNPVDATQPITLDFAYLISGVNAFGALSISNAAAQGDLASGVAKVP